MQTPVRATENYPPNHGFISQHGRSSCRSRPNLRWKDNVNEDAKMISATNGQWLARNRKDKENRQGIVEAELVSNNHNDDDDDKIAELGADTTKMYLNP